MKDTQPSSVPAGRSSVSSQGSARAIVRPAEHEGPHLPTLPPFSDPTFPPTALLSLRPGRVISEGNCL